MTTPDYLRNAVYGDCYVRAWIKTDGKEPQLVIHIERQHVPEGLGKHVVCRYRCPSGVVSDVDDLILEAIETAKERAKQLKEFQ